MHLTLDIVQIPEKSSQAPFARFMCSIPCGGRRYNLHEVDQPRSEVCGQASPVCKISMGPGHEVELARCLAGGLLQMAWKRAAAGEDWGDYVQNSNYPVPSVVGGAMQAGGKLRQGRDKFNKLGGGKGYVVA